MHKDRERRGQKLLNGGARAISGSAQTGLFTKRTGLEDLVDFVHRHRRLFVLTGAGCSTASGIPDYRDADGQWKHARPVMYQDFLHSESVRQKYWARSVLGWPTVLRARPNAAHLALARLERAGYVHQLVTQNVDGLHHKAGSRRLIDLHGRLHSVECLRCRRCFLRESLQTRLRQLNPDLQGFRAVNTPDGDVDADAACATVTVSVPGCAHCGGILKPTVTFFGEAVPRARVESAYERLREAHAVLVVGSSLMVYSGYRFCRAALVQGKPIAAVNLGRTRVDDDLTVKLSDDCGRVLTALSHHLGAG